MGLGIVGLLRDYFFEELDGGRPPLLLEPDECQMILRLRIFRVGGQLGLKFFFRGIQIAAAQSEDPQAEMRGGYLGIEFQGPPEFLRGFIDLVLAGIGVAPKNMHGGGIRLHAQELLKNSLGLLSLMCAREGSAEGEKQFGRIRMYGPGATQRIEGGLILASLEQGEPKIQVDIGKGTISAPDSFEFFGSVREALLAKCGERAIVVLAGGLGCGAERDHREP